MANRLEKIEKLCNPKMGFNVTCLGLTVKYTGFGDVWVTDSDMADHCTPIEAIDALQTLIDQIKEDTKPSKQS